MVDRTGDDEHMEQERLKTFRSVVSWCETAADLLAWRMRCEAERVPLKWADEMVKGRAVLSALARLDMVSPDGFRSLDNIITMPGELSDPDKFLQVISPVLLKGFNALVPKGPMEPKVIKSVGIRANVGRGLLGSVARLVLEDIMTRELDRFMCASARIKPNAALKERSLDATPTDRVIARAAAAQGKKDPQFALESSIEALAAARAAVTKARADVTRNRLRVKNKRQAARRAAK